MTSFLIVTTRDLPEAYFLAAALEARRQRIGIINITGRPIRAKLRVLGRLRRNRGMLYLVDLLLARMLRGRYMPVNIRPFPEIDEAAIAGMKQRWPRHTCLDPHGAATLQFIRDFDPDHILLAGAPVLKPSLFSLARQGAFNRHLGMLPDYKGSDCPVWALALNDADHVGFTIHRVEEKVDVGDVLYMEHVPIEPGNTFVDYLAGLQRRASEAFVDILNRVIDGPPIAARAQRRGGRFVPPAGLRVLRRARENFDRLAHALITHPSADQVVRPRLSWVSDRHGSTKAGDIAEAAGASAVHHRAVRAKVRLTTETEERTRGR